MSDFEQNFLNAWSQQIAVSLSPQNAADVSRARMETTREKRTRDSRPNDTLDNDVRPKELSMNHSSRLHSEGIEPARFDGSISGFRDPLPVIVENEFLQVPLRVDDIVSPPQLKQLRMFYRYLKVKRGLAEVIIPRRLVQIDCVKIEENSRTAGEVTRSLDCGRGLQFFHHPKTAPQGQIVTEEAQKPPPVAAHEGLEFIRVLDRRAIGGVIMAPPTASLVFIVVWLVVHLRNYRESENSKVYMQAVVGTAFTVASYLVTTGALITGLVAYVDNKPRELRNT